MNFRFPPSRITNIVGNDDFLCTLAFPNEKLPPDVPIVEAREVMCVVSGDMRSGQEDEVCVTCGGSEASTDGFVKELGTVGPTLVCDKLTGSARNISSVELRRGKGVELLQ